MAARGLQQPSDLNIPHPTPAESALNPTRTIHYEYQHFLRTLKKKNISEYDNPENVDFRCTRDSFYYALSSFSSTESRKQRAIQRFNMCAIQQGPHADPVDAAIHAYSKLIVNLMNTNTLESMREAFDVVQFLKLDYADEMSDDESIYDQTKDHILLLFGKDMLSHPANSALVYSQPIYDDMVNLLINIFGDEARFIRSSEIVKHLIFFYLLHTLPNMVQKYWEVSPLTKAHLFAYILNTPAARQMTRSTPMFNQIMSQISNLESPLNTLLGSGLYPEASRYVFDGLQSNTLGRGGKKQTLRNKKKRINKNNKNNKKTRRSRFSKVK